MRRSGEFILRNDIKITIHENEKDTHESQRAEAIAIRFYTQPLTPKQQLRSVDVRVRLTVD